MWTNLKCMYKELWVGKLDVQYTTKHRNFTSGLRQWLLLTGEVQLKAFAGVFCIADELQPHGARGGVQDCVQQLGASKHPQETSRIAAAIKDLEGGERGRVKQKTKIQNKKKVS